jgi:hypothetical protein
MGQIVGGFDATRGAFLLIVAVIGTELALVAAGAGTCIWYAARHGAGLAECKAANFSGILADALAVALALFGLRARRDGDG